MSTSLSVSPCKMIGYSHANAPVMKVSSDFGKIAWTICKLTSNGTIASGEVKPVL